MVIFVCGVRHACATCPLGAAARAAYQTFRTLLAGLAVLMAFSHCDAAQFASCLQSCQAGKVEFASA